MTIDTPNVAYKTQMSKDYPDRDVWLAKRATKRRAARPFHISKTFSFKDDRVQWSIGRTYKRAKRPEA